MTASQEISPAAFSIKKRPGNGVACEYQGPVTSAVIAAAQAKVSETLSRLKNPTFLIIDHSKSHPKDIVHDEVWSISQRTKALLMNLPSRFIVAMVAPEGLSFGLARMWYAYLGVEGRVNILKTRLEAEAWIEKTLGKKK